MSLLSSDRAEIFLSPRGVDVVRRKGGFRAAPAERASVPCGEAGQSVWQPAVEALATAVSSGPWKGADARVTLSNHFVRYALVPRVPGLKRQERSAVAEHHFSTIYGEASARWRIALAELDDSEHFLGAAVDRELLDQVVAVLTAVGIRPRAVEPFLARGYNACRRAFNGDAAWLAVVEPGRACVAHLASGRWQALRSQRLTEPLEETLPALLEQTMLASAPQAGVGKVYFVSRDGQEFAFAADSPWSFERVALDA